MERIPSMSNEFDKNIDNLLNGDVQKLEGDLTDQKDHVVENTVEEDVIEPEVSAEEVTYNREGIKKAKDESEEKDSIDGLCMNGKGNKEFNPYKAAPETIKEPLPRYMRPTAAQSQKIQMTQEDNRQKTVAAVKVLTGRTTIVEPPKKDALPRYMRPTASSISRTSLAPSIAPVRSHQIREVDIQNKPSYMRDTAAYKRRTEPISNKPLVLSQIRMIDPQNKPRYMKDTRASTHLVTSNKPISTPPIQPRKIKEIDIQNIPRYMKDTRASKVFVQSIQKEEKKNPHVINSHQIKEVDINKLPRYMQLTKATTQYTVTIAKKKTVNQIKPTLPPHIESPSIQSVVSAKYMKQTASFGMMVKKYEEDRKRRQMNEAELLRQRNSIAVKRERWDKRVDEVRCVALKRKEKVRQEIEMERRQTIGDQLPRYMKDTIASKQLNEANKKK